MSKVFLGGTTNKSIWREELIKELKINYFNPVVENWNEDCIKEEERQKWNECDIHLYVFSKEQAGFYSFVELMDSLYKTNTIFVYLNEFDEVKTKSLNAIGKKVEEWKGIWLKDNENGSLSDIKKIAEFLND